MKTAKFSLHSCEEKKLPHAFFGLSIFVSENPKVLQLGSKFRLVAYNST